MDRKGGDAEPGGPPPPADVKLSAKQTEEKGGRKTPSIATALGANRLHLEEQALPSPQTAFLGSTLDIVTVSGNSEVSCSRKCLVPMETQ